MAIKTAGTVQRIRADRVLAKQKAVFQPQFVYKYLLQIACLGAVIVVSRGMVIHLYVVPVRTKAM